MKNVVLNKQDFKDIYGLSCVENLILYILKQEGMMCECLYCESFYSISEIEHYFLKNQATHANFYLPKRIQNIAQERGWVRIRLIDSEEFIDVRDNEYCCILTKPEFTVDKFGVKLMREDHYLLLTNMGEQYYYLNDYPCHIGQISLNEIRNIYNGRIIAIEVLKNLPIEIDKYRQEMISKMHVECLEYHMVSKNVMTIRDVIGVLRIIRRRMLRLLGISSNDQDCNEYLNLLDHSYAIIEYLRLKHQLDEKKIETMCDEIIRKDNQLIRKFLS